MAFVAVSLKKKDPKGRDLYKVRNQKDELPCVGIGKGKFADHVRLLQPNGSETLWLLESEMKRRMTTLKK